MIAQSIGKNSAILGIFALVTAGLIASTFQGTKGRIADAERQAAQKALNEVVPPSQHNNDLLSDALQLSPEQAAELGVSQDESIHVAKAKGNTVAFIFPALAPDGYSGDIKMIVGVNKDGSVAGVRVLAHKETPGLGDKVDLNKSDWVLSFDGKSLQNPIVDRWKVKKDGGNFDQFTGATITPRAVVKQVKKVLEYYASNKEALFEKAAALPSTSAHK